jgi:hypothetical protein
MTISELITELQKLQALHGNLPVTRRCEGDEQEEVSFVQLSNESFYTDEYEPTKEPHIHLS